MKILLLDDNEDDIFVAKRYVPEGTELIAVKDRASFEKVLESDRFDLVILDYRIPGWAGVDASIEVRRKWPNMPILILSGTINDEMIPALEEKQIDDVLLKDRPHRLAWAIRKALRDRLREQKALESQRQQLVGEVATGIAHDIRNMLTPIVGVLHLLEGYIVEGKPIPQDKVHLLKAAQRSSDRMVDMINRMMLFVSGKNGHKENTHVKQVVLEFLQFLPGLLPGISIKSEVVTNAILIIDPTVIRQVILNFCVNARDAGAHNLHVIAADVELKGYKSIMGLEVSGSFCKIGVEDDGSGVPPEILKDIFEPFFTTKPPGKGTGMGLSTVKNIVHQYGGFVDVVTAVPSGSIFSAYFSIR